MRGAPLPAAALTAVLAATASPTGLSADVPQADPGATAAVETVVVEIDGGTIRALCSPGVRRVVLVHGDGSTADGWRPVLERLEGRVGACAYDRRGSGASEPAPRERGWYELLDEMRRIHAALEVRRGYVLVGQGLGGLYARVYAVDRPTDVDGLVLVDPAHEDLPRHVRAGMPREAWSAWVDARDRPNADGVVEARIGDRARRQRLEGIPVTVLTATIRPDGEGWDPRFVNEAARRVHAQIVRGNPRARHIPASRSGPDIHLDQPSLVAEEIVRVVRALELQPARRGM